MLLCIVHAMEVEGPAVQAVQEQETLQEMGIAAATVAAAIAVSAIILKK